MMKNLIESYFFWQMLLFATIVASGFISIWWERCRRPRAPVGVISIKVGHPTSCPYCHSVGTLQDAVVAPEREECVTTLEFQSTERTKSGNVVLGGTAVHCKMKICSSCNYVLLFKDG